MSFNFKTLDEAGTLTGKTVLLRLDLNVPIVSGKVESDFRVRRSLKTLAFLRKAGARTVIVSHTDSKETDSLQNVTATLAEHIPVTFVPSLGELSSTLERLAGGSFLLLENIRREPGELSNDGAFSERLASFADIFVNDAFAVSHRVHASIVGVPRFLPSFGGFLMAEEISSLSKAFHPERPFLFILAGANKKLTPGAPVSATKFPLVKKFLTLADSVFIAGALANDLFKAKGYDIGLSTHSPEDYGFAEMLSNQKLILPSDVVVKTGDNRETKKPNDVSPSDRIVDAGNETIATLQKEFERAKFIVWNGPLGEYEHGFSEGTEALARAVAASGAESIVGGGDTLAAVSKLGLEEKFSFISTGGGAMLEFLADETLPGIKALEEAALRKAEVASK